MILRENGTRFCAEGKVFTIGGRISANGESEYEGLFGTITEIRSGADRETENDVPDIYCDFEIPASEEMLRELEARFSGLYGEIKTIDDISLDCVIMSPDMLEPLDTPPGKRDGFSCTPTRIPPRSPGRWRSISGSAPGRCCSPTGPTRF